MDELEKKGLIYAPEDAKEKNTPLPTTGLVVEVGMGVGREMRDVLRPTTGVMFPKFSGSDFAIEEEDYRILDVGEILCTLELEQVTPVAKRPGKFIEDGVRKVAL